MKILFAAGECHPFFKTGGLADVASALPKEIKKQGHDIRVILPLYKELKEEYKDRLEHVTDFIVAVSYRKQYCGVKKLELEGMTYYFIDSMYYFDRDGLYGYIDDGERFSFFSSAVLEALERIDFIPDVLHVNDWHTAIIPLLLKVKYHWINSYRKIKTVLTIHNLKFQGIFPFEVLGDLLNVGPDVMTDDGVEFFGNVNYLKGGINFADFVTTVSPTYADEIKTEFYGENLHGLMNRISFKLKGIINGIDTDINNPETDKIIPNNYSYENLEGKRKNKEELLEELGLPKSDEPLIAIVSRLTSQKGLDILAYGLEELLNNDIKMVVLGTGEARYENMFKHFQWRFPEKISSKILFDGKLAQRIYGGADMILVPSLFEPCGLTQMIGMRYGTLPIVRETGGLKDTVTPWNKYTNEGTGFTFSFYNHMDLLGAIDRALEAYSDKNIWERLMKNAMEKDFSWKGPASDYIDIYKKITKENVNENANENANEKANEKENESK